MAFFVGQRVVCVGDDNGAMARWNLVKGQIYTVSAIGSNPVNGAPMIDTAEMGEFPRIKTFPCYYARRFRPVVEPKTDISIFTAMLSPKKATEPA